MGGDDRADRHNDARSKSTSDPTYRRVTGVYSEPHKEREMGARREREGREMIRQTSIMSPPEDARSSSTLDPTYRKCIHSEPHKEGDGRMIESDGQQKQGI
jgi:hypothetical protein